MREFLKAALQGAAIAAGFYMALRVHRTWAARLYWRDVAPYIGAFEGVTWQGPTTATTTGGNGHPYTTTSPAT